MIFNLKEAFKTGFFISGTSGSGKSNLGFHLADKILKANAIVYVFDPSQAWIRNSGMPQYQTIESPLVKEIPATSTVFDISLLYVSQQQIFVEQFCRILFNNRVRSKHRPQTFLIFEEAQLYIPEGRSRSRAGQELMRLITVGRNFNIRYGLITQFASLVDKIAVKMTKQRYFGYTDELNDVKYLANFIGKEWAEQLETLKIGEFIYDKGRQTHKAITPLFKNRIQVKHLLKRNKSETYLQSSPKNKTPSKEIVPLLLRLLVFLFAIIVTAGPWLIR